MIKKKKKIAPPKPLALVFYLGSWVLLIVGVLFTTIGSLSFVTTGQPLTNKSLFQAREIRGIIATSKGAFASHVLGKPIKSVTQTDDARAVIVANFLKRYKSPLKPYDYYGKKLVEIADEFDIDFRLLPAIAMQESNLCKVIPASSHNCLGLGVHTRGTWGFDSYEQNFAAAAKILKENYIDIGLVTPEQIMTKYTPGSNGSWAFSVNRWMREMRYDDPVAGKVGKEDANLLEFVN